jgi:hypothetical protein
MKVTFSESERAQQLQRELLDIMANLQTTAERLHAVSWRVSFPDVTGKLQGYADIIRNVGDDISENFEFYR